jgi:hypothetical protein
MVMPVGDRWKSRISGSGVPIGVGPVVSPKHLAAPDGLKGVAEVLDLGRRAVVGPDDCDDVIPAAHFEKLIFAQELKRDIRQSALFLERNCFDGTSLPARFHFDEDQSVAVARDQIDFPLFRPIPTQEDAHALAFQVASGQSLAALS